MTRTALAFQQLNLRWNPFGEPDPEDIPRLSVVEVEPYVRRLRRPGFAVQFLGESGRGKSTHLMALHEYFPAMPYLRFPENTKPPKIPYAAILFLDETQRLPVRLRQHVFARRASFAIGTHEDHSTELARARVETVSVRLQGMTAEHLGAIVERRIEWARRDPGPVPTVSAGTLTRLVEEYGDDLASILRRLYQEFQALEEQGNGSNTSAL